jgi:hypothetical protein
LNASALRDADGNVIGAICILRDMRAYETSARSAGVASRASGEDPRAEKFEEVVVGRELKMIALEKEVEKLQREVERLKAEQGPNVTLDTRHEPSPDANVHRRETDQRRRAFVHIMGDLRDTTERMQRREQEHRESKNNSYRRPSSPHSVN